MGWCTQESLRGTGVFRLQARPRQAAWLYRGRGRTIPLLSESFGPQGSRDAAEGAVC
jgi:hypothetical protein